MKYNYKFLNSKWEWRLYCERDKISIWLRLEFTDELISVLELLNVRPDRSIGILYFKSSEDVSFFRLKAGV